MGDQLIVVQGPSNRMFATEEDLAEMQFVTRVIGEEAAAVRAGCVQWSEACGCGYCEII